jgi:hypothetical protein
MNEVTDPNILAQLNSSQSEQEVTDPQILAQLNGTEQKIAEKVNKPVDNRSVSEKTGLSAAAELVEPINALGGGIAGGIVKTASNIGGLATDIIGSGNPELRDSLREQGRPIRDMLTPSPDSISGEAMANYPTTAKVGDVIGQAAPYAPMGLVSGSLTAGAASADDGFMNRLAGASGGLVLGAGVYGTGVAIQKGIAALRSSLVVKEAEKYVKEKITQLGSTLKGTPREVGAQSIANVYNVTKQVDDELFTQFRSAQGNFAPEIRQVKRSVEDMLDQYSTNMSGPQKQVLQSTLARFENASSIADLHDLRKFLATNSKSFLDKDGSVFAESYKGIRTIVDTQMRTAAEKAGVLKEYLNANAHYQQKLLPLMNAGSDDVAAALSERGQAIDPMRAAKVLDEWVDKNIKYNKPNETKVFLKTLDPVGREAVELRLIEKTLDKVKDSTNIGLAFRKEFAKYGPTSEILLSGNNAKFIKGVMRVLDEAKPLLENNLKKGEFYNMPAQAAVATLSKAANSAPGQFILKMIGEPSTPKAIISELLTKSSAILGGEVGSNLVGGTQENGN